MNIHFLHINDVHSSLENYMRLGLRLRQLRDRLRQQGEAVWTLDVGDLVDRARPESDITLGRINAALMQSLQVDAWVFGNNEGLSLPVEVWSTLGSISGAAILGTNLRRQSGLALEGMVDTQCFVHEGVRIGMFGLTPPYELPYRPLGVRPTEPRVVARETVERLRACGCDLIVCLSHLGLPEDRELAHAVSGIDLILGGHTHHWLESPEYVGSTMICQAGWRAGAFGHVTLRVETHPFRITHREAHLERVDVHGPLDPAMWATYREWMAEIELSLGRPVLNLQTRLVTDFQTEENFSNLLSDALLDAKPAHIGMMMAGALVASMLPGPVDMRQFLAACSTPTKPVSMDLSGWEIRAILERGLVPEVQLHVGRGFGFRGAVVGRLAVSGAMVDVDESGTRVIDVWMNGDRMLDDFVYRVTACEYLYLAPVFPEFKNGRNVEFGRSLAREILIDYVQDEQNVERAKDKRYRVVTDRSFGSEENGDEGL